MAILGKTPDGYIDQDIERQFEEENPKKQANRSAFEIDKGRIVHSAAFRRLQGKTQVLGVGERDFYRTRLTHSLEVAQIGRGICNEIENPKGFKIDTDLVEAICLAHDIGHPAFGHSGEKFLNKLMFEQGGFGANAQNLRVVTFIETKRKEGGLNLSRAALDGLTKYPVVFSGKDSEREKPEFVYSDDAALFKWIKTGVRARNKASRPVECEIAEWADTLAYSVNDIEDNLRAGLLDFVEMERRADEIAQECSKHGVEKKEIIEKAKALQTKLILEPGNLREKKAALKRWTSGTIFSLISGCTFYIRDKEEASNRYRHGFRVPERNKRESKILKATALVLAFKDPRVVTLEFKGRKILERLYEAFCAEPTLLPRDFQELISHQKKATKRIVGDFISGMTDAYAGEYYSRLFEPGKGSFYQDV
jgi:dGTPase